MCYSLDVNALNFCRFALLPLPEDEFKKGQVGDLGVLPDFRVRILPVLGTMPAVFGYTAANHVILSITGKQPSRCVQPGWPLDPSRQ